MSFRVMYTMLCQRVHYMVLPIETTCESRTETVTNHQCYDSLQWDVTSVVTSPAVIGT